MTTPFCWYLTNHQRFEYDQLSTCCWIHKKVDTNDPVEVEKYFTWARNLTDWDPACNRCRDMEARGQESFRVRANIRPDRFGFSPEDQPGDITSLEFQFDTECNGACLICGPKNSTTWQKYNTTDGKEIKKIIDISNEITRSSRLEIVKKTTKFDKIRYITFLGGEPLKSNFHLTILEEINKVKNLNDLSLSYVTNGSMRPSLEVIELWGKCKSVQINVSVDGIGEHFNYLRWPLQWHHVCDNIRFIVDQKLPNLKLTSSYSINPFNIFYHDRYVAWALEFFKNDTNVIPFFRNPFRTDGVINLNSIPNKLKYEIFRKYGTMYPKLVKLIEGYNEKSAVSFLKYIREHDTKRNLNWKEVFPEIVPYFADLEQLVDKNLDTVNKL
jgi:pyruvate-formate lyase-activating enzyme